MGKNKASGSDRFESFYRELFAKRWDALKESLLQKKEYVAVINPFYQDLSFEEIESKFQARRFDKIVDFFCLQKESWEKPQADKNGLYSYYLLDPASIFPVVALELQESDKVLDMCAAPGGKSFLIGQKLTTGELISNDRSTPRKKRLEKVFKDYFPENYLKRFKTTNFDGGRWCLYEKEVFDKVLLDAPCSSERHVLESKEHLEKWKESRVKMLSKNQFTLLASAFEVLKEGGRLVYSTCALSSQENDDVIEKLLKKREGRVRVIESPLIVGEKTQYGVHILPDKTNLGPIYYAVIEKC